MWKIDIAEALIWAAFGIYIAIGLFSMLALTGCVHYPPQSIDDLGGCSVNRAAQGGC